MGPLSARARSRRRRLSSSARGFPLILLLASLLAAGTAAHVFVVTPGDRRAVGSWYRAAAARVDFPRRTRYHTAPAVTRLPQANPPSGFFVCAVEGREVDDGELVELE